ncbi:MAG: Rpn family recombination-promoting nuclease/putative transposase, partial [Hungatella sp.]
MDKTKRKKLKDLNLLDDFLFSVAIKDLEICKSVLEIILNKNIVDIYYNQAQMELNSLPGYKGVRLDVIIEDDQGLLYNIEVQVRDTKNLPKRTRFYQSLIDFPLLEKGEADYNCLNNTYIIMIMPFDLFGQGKYCYTFENVCLEDGHIRLGDGAIKIFLNTEGTNPDEVSKTLVDFLHYVKQTSDESVSDTTDDKIREIHAKMQKIKSNREIGVAYMQTWERERMLR